MFKFFKDAQAEIEHVVWPTPNETKKYMIYNIVVIITLTIFLMILGYLIQSGLVAVRAQFSHDDIIPTTDTVTQGELDSITDALEQKMSQSGSISGEAISTPVLIESTGAIAQ